MLRNTWISLLLVVAVLCSIVGLFWLRSEQRNSALKLDEMSDLSMSTDDKALQLPENCELKLTFHSQLTADFSKEIERVTDGPTILTENEKEEFCNWEHIFSLSQLNYYKDEQNIDLPEVDFNQDGMIISFGRKIEKIVVREESTYPQMTSTLGFVTFGTAHYTNTVFVYTYSPPVVMWNPISVLLHAQDGYKISNE